MVEASSADVSRVFGSYRELADGSRGKAEAVTVMHYDKPSVVILSVDEYERLKRRDKRVLATEDLPEWLVQQISITEMDRRILDLDQID